MAHVATVTIDNTKVSADLTDFVIYIDLSDLPTTEFWGTVANGGGDIRVFKDDDTTELAREVVFCDTATDTGEMHVKFSGTLSSSVDTDIHIYADGTSSEPAVTATYGRNAVWSNFNFAHHFQESSGNRTDSAGNSHTAVDNGSAGSRTGALAGNAVDFDGTNDYLAIADSTDLDLGTGAYMYKFWAIHDTSLQGWLFERYDYDTNNRSYHLYSFQGTGASATRLNISTAGNNDTTVFTVDLTSIISANTWHHVVLTRVGSTTRLFINGVQRDSGTDNNNYYNATAPLWLGANPTTAINTFHNGGMDELVFDKGTGWDSDQALTDYNNQNSPSTFYSTVGVTPTNTLSAVVGSFTLTSIDTSFTVNRVLTANTGSFTVTGISAGLNLTKNLLAEVGAFTLTGISILFDTSLRTVWSKRNKNSSIWTKRNKS